MNSGARDAAQTGHKRQATDTGRHVLVIPRFGLLLANKSDATLAARLCCMRFFKFFPFVFFIRSGFYLYANSHMGFYLQWVAGIKKTYH